MTFTAQWREGLPSDATSCNGCGERNHRYLSMRFGATEMRLCGKCCRGADLPESATRAIPAIERNTYRADGDLVRREAFVPPGLLAGLPVTGTLCSACFVEHGEAQPQYRSPSGVTCERGHGGSPPLVVCRYCGEQQSHYIHRHGDRVRTDKAVPPVGGEYHAFVSYAPGPASTFTKKPEGTRLPPPEAMKGYEDQFGGEDYPTFTAPPDEERRVPLAAVDPKRPVMAVSVFLYPDASCKKCDGLGVRSHDVAGLIGLARIRVVCDCVTVRRAS